MLWIVTQTPIARALVVDRLVAAVEDRVICSSRVVMVKNLLASEKLSRHPADYSDDAVLERLIDRTLVLREIRRFGDNVASDEQTAALMRDRYGDLGNSGLREEVVRLGWTWAEFVEWHEQEVLIEKFVQERFRAFIVVTEDEVAARLQQEFGAEAAAARDPQTQTLMENLMVQERLNERLLEWVAELKARIQIYRVEFAGTEAAPEVLKRALDWKLQGQRHPLTENKER